MRDAPSLDDPFAVIRGAHQAGDFVTEIKLCGELLQREPNNATAWHLLSQGCDAIGKADEACQALQQVVKLQPSNAVAWTNLGVILDRREQHDEAERTLRWAAYLDPNSTRSLGALAGTLLKMGRHQEAISAFRRVTELTPDDPEAQTNLGYALLNSLELAEGWSQYEWRLKLPKALKTQVDLPRWQGEPINGKSLLLVAEQGLGDTIQFIRYATEIKRQFRCQIIAAVQPALCRLLKDVEGLDTLLSRDSTLPSADVWSPLMSLPGLMGHNTPSEFPAKIPYLSADSTLLEHWRVELSKYPRPRIGIAWKGSNSNARDAARSVQLLEFAPIGQISGATLISLQCRDGLTDLDDIRQLFEVHRLDENVDETSGPFMDTAAIMKNLDVVISVDTATAHLAGALGVPIWVPLCFAPDWRWQVAADTTPWYPTMRLFRQSSPGSWKPVFEQMAAEFRKQRSVATVPPRSAPQAKVVLESPVKTKQPESNAPSRELKSTAEKDLRDVIECALQIAVGRIDSDSPQVVDSFKFWGIAVVLYRSNCRQRLLIVRGGLSDSSELIDSAVRGMSRHPRLIEFEPLDSGLTRIQIDFLLDEPQAIEFGELRESAVGPNRFEYGVDGLRIVGRTMTRYFLPGDAFVRSVLGLIQLRRQIQILFADEPFAELEFSRFRSKSYLRFEKRWIPLFRGYPVLGDRVSADDLFDRAKASVDRIVRTQSNSGQFEYYYDVKTDSHRDHEHPTRNPKTTPYYNMVRHSGGVLSLLFYEAAIRDSRLIQAISSVSTQQVFCVSTAELTEHSQPLRKAINAAFEFYLSTLVEYLTGDGRPAAYSVCNRKAKLGGSGIGLYSLALYQHLFPDRRYEEPARKLANHLICEIQDSGEFMYYHTYLGRKVARNENQLRFSFYYPGEAVVGLAGYLKHVCQSDPERKRIVERLHRALRFLVFDRPQKYPQHFAPLPADSWLMMGINELWDLSDFQQEEYKQFVFGDADQMCDHQYSPKNSLFPDYIGSFFYQHGDHPYPDGARAEGLLAAYMLALKIGDNARQKRYFKCLVRLAWACLHLCNTRESLYSVPNPDHAYGSIRFKFTRQWVRVDTTQHVASFFLKVLPHFVAEGSSRSG